MNPKQGGFSYIIAVRPGCLSQTSQAVSGSLRQSQAVSGRERVCCFIISVITTGILHFQFFQFCSKLLQCRSRSVYQELQRAIEDFNRCSSQTRTRQKVECFSAVYFAHRYRVMVAYLDVNGVHLVAFFVIRIVTLTTFFTTPRFHPSSARRRTAEHRITSANTSSIFACPTVRINLH